MSERAKISADGTGVWVSTRSERPEGGFDILALWLVGWTLGELAVLIGLILGHGDGKAFLGIWLLGWSLAGAFVWYIYLWPRLGYAVLEIDDGRLRIKNILGPVVWKREFDLTKVRQLHAGKSTIAFEVDSTKTSYGEDISGEDLQAIVAAVRQKFPDICGEPEHRRKKHGAGR